MPTKVRSLLVPLRSVSNIPEAPPPALFLRSLIEPFDRWLFSLTGREVCVRVASSVVAKATESRREFVSEQLGIFRRQRCDSFGRRQVARTAAGGENSTCGPLEEHLHSEPPIPMSAAGPRFGSGGSSRQRLSSGFCLDQGMKSLPLTLSLHSILLARTFSLPRPDF